LEEEEGEHHGNFSDNGGDIYDFDYETQEDEL
jgi:hypothetical protein